MKPATFSLFMIMKHKIPGRVHENTWISPDIFKTYNVNYQYIIQRVTQTIKYRLNSGRNVAYLYVASTYHEATEREGYS